MTGTQGCALGDIADDVVQVGTFLQVVAEKDERLACLRTIVKNPRILEWIRRVCTGK